MKVFILEHVERLTESWHSSGGLVVIAKDRREAKNLVREEWCNQPTVEEWKRAKSFDVDAKPSVWIFPDEGCC